MPITILPSSLVDRLMLTSSPLARSDSIPVNEVLSQADTARSTGRLNAVRDLIFSLGSSNLIIEFSLSL